MTQKCEKQEVTVGQLVRGLSQSTGGDTVVAVSEDTERQKRLISLINYRDLSERVQSVRIKPRMLLRSSMPGKVTEEDAKQFISEIGLRHIVDLRSHRETKVNFIDDKLTKHFDLGETMQRKAAKAKAKVEKAGGKKKEKGVVVNDEIVVDEHENCDSCADARLLTYTNIPLMGARLSTAMFVSPPVYEILKIPYYFARYPACRVKQTVLMKANKSLAGFYIRSLQSCKHYLKIALQQFTHPANYPIVYFCAVGKDRTGLVTMLLLGCLGVSKEEIVNDYALSQVIADNPETRKVILEAGFPEEWVDAQTDAMGEAIDWIYKNYGSFSKYLKRIGISFKKQQRMRDILTVNEDGTVKVDMTTTKTIFTNGYQESATDAQLLRRQMKQMKEEQEKQEKEYKQRMKFSSQLSDLENAHPEHQAESQQPEMQAQQREPQEEREAPQSESQLDSQSEQTESLSEQSESQSIGSGGGNLGPMSTERSLQQEHQEDEPHQERHQGEKQVYRLMQKDQAFSPPARTIEVEAS